MKKTITILIILFLLISWLIYIYKKENERKKEIEEIRKEINEPKELNNLPEIPVERGKDKG